MSKCHCDGAFEEHDGMQHCTACGCYYRDGALAPDHTACRTAPTSTPAPAEPDAPFVNPAVTPIPIQKSKGTGVAKTPRTPKGEMAVEFE